MMPHIQRINFLKWCFIFQKRHAPTVAPVVDLRGKKSSSSNDVPLYFNQLTGRVGGFVSGCKQLRKNGKRKLSVFTRNVI